MSDQPSNEHSGAPHRRSHPVGIGLAILVAIPLLYLLSVPVILWMAKVRVHPVDVQYHPLQKPWVRQYCRPYAWVMEQTPLREVLDRYARLMVPKQNPLWKNGYEARLQVEELKKQADELIQRSHAIREKLEQQRQKMPLPLPEDSRPAPVPNRGSIAPPSYIAPPPEPEPDPSKPRVS